MNVFVDGEFWAFVAGAYVLLHLALPVPATFRFAVVNLGIVGVFFGLEPAVALTLLGLGSWLLLRPVAALRARGRSGWLHAYGWLCIAATVAVFVAYKRALDGSLLPGHPSLGGPEPGQLYDVLRTLSFSYVFLRTVDLVRSVVWARERLLDPLSLTGYLGPFHMLLAGPIAPYRDHVEDDRVPRPTPTFGRLLDDVSTIVAGLFFKLVIAESMKVYRVGVGGSLSPETWFDSLYALVYLYFDFAGYSLVALGIGRMLHVTTPRNFDSPFAATSVTEFWSSWHKSLGTFVRNNIFLPLQLFLARRVRRGAATTLASLLPLVSSFLFVAMWHRITPRFMVWGVAMGAIVCAEKLVRDRVLARPWARRPAVVRAARVVCPVYTVSVVVTGIHFVAGEVFV